MSLSSIAMLGYGAIGRVVAPGLRDSGALSCVLTRGAVPIEARALAGAGALFVTSLASLLNARPRVVIECAGHGALIEHGAAILEAGIELAVVSTGALADEPLYRALVSAARQGGARLHVLAGAMGGIEALAAAREQGLDLVHYRSRKPPRAWRGTPAERMLDLDRLTEPATFDQGDARRIALAYPQNANVVSTIALAAGGYERVQVALIADPLASGNSHELAVKGAFGEMTVRMDGVPLPGNPKTSMLAALSALRFARTRNALVSV